MHDRTRRLWETQTQPIGDRRGLFAAVADTVDAHTALQPGSYVDLTPSFVWPAVTYVDTDRRAAQFFADGDGIRELLVEHVAGPTVHEADFIHADYTDDPDLADDSFDLLISLHAGFVSEHCTRYLRPGGVLLVNSRHGDAAMASLDARYELRGVVTARSERYTARTDELDSYLVPKRDVDVTTHILHETGRGVVYTTSPFAYLFERVA